MSINGFFFIILIERITNQLSLLEKLEEYVKEIHITLFIFVLNNTSIIQDVLNKSLSFQSSQGKLRYV
jgi:hypothetical protein